MTIEQIAFELGIIMDCADHMVWAVLPTLEDAKAFRDLIPINVRMMRAEYGNDLRITQCYKGGWEVWWLWNDSAARSVPFELAFVQHPQCPEVPLCELHRLFLS